VFFYTCYCADGHFVLENSITSVITLSDLLLVLQTFIVVNFATFV